MYILGDIGNTETKLCLVSKKNKILKKITFSSKSVNNKQLSNLFTKKKIQFNKVEKVLFCSVVPKTFDIIKKFLSKKVKIKCFEVKNLNLKSLIKIKVNYKQVGSDRITNAISLMNNKNNYIILDFGTATTFDVLIKNTYFGGIIAPGVRLSLNSLSDKVLRDKFTPGAIIPPKYVSLIITSNVVAVPKSKIIKLFFLSIRLIALVILSDPTCL